MNAPRTTTIQRLKKALNLRTQINSLAYDNRREGPVGAHHTMDQRLLQRQLDCKAAIRASCVFTSSVVLVVFACPYCFLATYVIS